MGVNSVPTIRRFSEFKFVDDTALSQEDLTIQSQRVSKDLDKGQREKQKMLVDSSHFTDIIFALSLEP